MVTIVQKYGGSSLADVAAIHSVADAVAQRHRTGCRLVVVVSAMGKSTDQLMAQAHAVTQTPPQRELDMLVTAGERICMALLSMALQDQGVDAISLTGSQSGILTEDAHQGARIQAIRPHRIVDALAHGKVVIVAGYQGVSGNGEVTTLGRGGSDTTAVALGAALGAKQVEIYSDVDGVYTADPNVCPQARHLASLSYTLMGTMAQFGAKVLHPACVHFAQAAGITLVAAASRPQGGRVSRLSGAIPMAKPQAAISHVAQGYSLQADDADVLRAQLGRLAERGVYPMVCHAQSALFSHTALPGTAASVLLDGPQRARLQCTDVAMVTLCALGQGTQRVNEVYALLAQAHIQPIDVWAGPDTCTAVIARDALACGVLALHPLVPADI